MLFITLADIYPELTFVIYDIEYFTVMSYVSAILFSDKLIKFVEKNKPY